MERETLTKLRIFIDADDLFTGAASPNEHSASNLLLRMAELTLVEAITTSAQLIAEVERNLLDKIPKALPAFQMLVSRCLRVGRDPNQSELAEYDRLAHPQDLPILVTAVREGCSLLTPFNTRHYQPGHVSLLVMKPGDLVLRARYLLARLAG